MILKEGSNLEGDMPIVPINKLGQYFESDDSNVVIPISYHHRKVEAILDGSAGVSIHYKTMPPYTRSIHATSYGRVYGSA